MRDLNDVLLFCRVIEAGSFVGAARAMGVPAPTVSRRIARLEAAIGVRLIERTTRRVELTSLGSEFYYASSKGLGVVAAAEGRLRAASARPIGLLRVTAPIYLGSRYLTKWIAEFLHLYPDVEIEFWLTDAYVDLLGERVDVAFRGGRMPDSSLRVRSLPSSPRVLVASPDYLEREGEPKDPEQISAHAAVLVGRSRTASWTLRGPNGTVSVEVSGRLAVDNLYAALLAAAEGLGIAFLPMGTVSDSLGSGALRQLLKQYTGDPIPLYLVHPSASHPPSALRAFLDFIDERARQPVPWAQ